MAFLIYSIEDDKDIAQIINRTLAKQGYEVYSFGIIKLSANIPYIIIPLL